MIPFETLSPLVRALFALWALLLCLSCVTSAVLAAVNKRYWLSALALILFIPVYYIWQVIFDLSLSISAEQTASAVTAALCGTRYAWWLFGFILLTLAAALLIFSNVRYDRTSITPGAIKVFLDKMPCGVCCWRDSGKVLFSNVCMSRLCAALTGLPLMNGEQFRSAVKDGIITVGDKVWRFTCRDFVSGGGRLHEMIASDVTAEYARTRALEKDKAELSQLKGRLLDYYLSIDDTVRRQETLQAKSSIHDEMNRLMLTTTAAKSDGAELDRIFSQWEQNALLLCMQADERADAHAADVEKLAKALKIQIIWRDPPPDTLTDGQRALLFTAAKEAAVNAVKHAGAKEIAVSFERTDGDAVCRFENGGRMPADPVKFTGGLANLSRLAERQGASLYAQVGETFTLTLTFPDNQPNG